MRRAERITDEKRRPCAKSTAEEEIETSTIGRGGSDRAVAARRYVTLLILPLEDQLPVAASQLERRQRTVGRKNAFERRRGRDASQRPDENEQRTFFHFGVTRVMASPWTSLSSTANPLTTRPNTV